MAVPRFKTGDDDKGVADIVSELWALLRDYARQETVDPLRNLLRFAGWGTAGSLVVGIGSSIIVIGVLRLVQTETGTALTGTLSFVPYVVALVLAGLGTVLSLKAIKRQGRPG